MREVWPLCSWISAWRLPSREAPRAMCCVVAGRNEPAAYMSSRLTRSLTGLPTWRAAALDRLGGIDRRARILVVDRSGGGLGSVRDPDPARRLVRRLLRLGDDQPDRLAGVADLVRHQRHEARLRLTAGEDEAERLEPVHVAVGEDEQHAGCRFCRARVELGEPPFG